MQAIRFSHELVEQAGILEILLGKRSGNLSRIGNVNGRLEIFSHLFFVFFPLVVGGKLLKLIVSQGDVFIRIVCCVVEDNFVVLVGDVHFHYSLLCLVY